MRSIYFMTGLLAVTALPAAAQQAAAQPDGRAVFEMVCAMCHSVAPPAKLAPPMSHAAAYYARRYSMPDSAAAAMVAYLKEPVAEKSAMPAHAIERFGLMPAQAHLSEEQLKAVARFVLTLADTAHGGGGMQHRGAGH
ncbi:MAG: cytochrome c [Gemmatimonadetes bacterium]|nr:cytochrome c [Gemmatimonadota bacterium]